MALRRDKKRHLPWLLEERARLFLDHAVSDRHPCAQVPEFKHRLNEKGLEDPAADLRVLKNAPRVSAVALSLEANFMDQREEGANVLRVNQVFDSQ